MKILLLYNRWSNTYKLFKHFAKKAANIPPLNILYIAAISEKTNNEVRVLDCEVNELQDSYILQYINNFKPDIIGMTAVSPFYHITENFAKLIKQQNPNQKIALGGRHVSIMKENCVTDYFDYYFLGEAELSWEMFLNQVPFNKIPGFIYKENYEVKSNLLMQSFENIDNIPFPARHLLNTNNYTSRFGKSTAIMTMRSCPFKCIFCAVDNIPVKYHSTEYSIDEIKICKKYDIKYFIFADDTLTLNKKHIINLCEQIIKNNLNIKWEASTRANLLDEELVVLMKKAGLVKMVLGLESLDDNMRKIMKKDIPIDSYIKSNALLKKHGIVVRNNLMIGLPGESIDTIRKTLSFIRYEKNVEDINISIAMPYPGTELYHMAKNNLNGLKLINDDMSVQTRYSNAVMQVGELTPKDIVKLHNDMYVSMFLALWRFKESIRRFGIIGFFITITRFTKSFFRIIINKNKLFFNLPNLFFKDK